MLGSEFFKKYKMQYKDCNNNLQKSINQLENLKNDLTDGRLPKSTFDGYFKVEKKTAAEINENVEVYCKFTNKYNLQFKELNPKIEKLIK